MKSSEQPQYGQQVSIASSSTNELKKIERKERKKFSKHISKLTRNMPEEEKILYEQYKDEIIKNRYTTRNSVKNLLSMLIVLSGCH